MRLNAFLLLLVACASAVNIFSDSYNATDKSLSNAEAFDAFAKSIEELMTKQHGEQTFNDKLTGAHNSILQNPKVLSTEAELDNLLNKLHKSYTKVHSSPVSSVAPKHKIYTQLPAKPLQSNPPQEKLPPYELPKSNPKEVADPVHNPNKVVPTLTYEGKTREQIEYEQEMKHKKEEQRRLDELAKMPKNCTAETPNGTICKGGLCYNGVCRKTGACIGECCNDYALPKLNGSPCDEERGECYMGECVAKITCYGDCCDNKAAGIALPDGTACAVGVCLRGGCVAERTHCVSGSCCDEVHATPMPRGHACSVNECQKPTTCVGFSAFCPDTEPVEDGTYCNGGTCKSGVCVRDIDINSKEAVCTEGECCDLSTLSFKAEGTACTNNQCHKQGSACTGKSAQCPPPKNATLVLENGELCEGGMCWGGVCKRIVECDEGECCRGGKMLQNYTDCSVGRCFAGKCVYDKVCIGDCCEDDSLLPNELKRLPNGSPCHGGMCLSGRCRALSHCFGECCDDGNMENDDLAKPDGVMCNHGNGYCKQGVCVSPKHTCEDGQCCNEFAGYTMPAGFPCHSDPCHLSMPCFGNSSVCISSTEIRPNGYPCPNNGTCEEGVCVRPPEPEPECVNGICCDLKKHKFLGKDVPCGGDVCKEVTYCTGESEFCPISLVPVEDGVICKQTLLGNWTCVDGVCEKPQPKALLPRCNVERACCDTFKQRVRANGTVCAEAFNECVETAYCNGFDTECPINFKADGSVCSGGMCVHGQCILGVDPFDNDTVHDIHVHHTRDGDYELIKITTLRKSDGSTFTKEVLVENSIIKGMQNKAEEDAKKALMELAEEKKKEKERIREEQFQKDVKDTLRRLEEEEQRKLDEMTHEELEALKNGTFNTHTTTVAQQQQEDPEDNTPEHKNLIASLDHSGNPIRYLKNAKPRNMTHAYMQCESGLCCNTHTGMFYQYGHVCGQPQNGCKVAICSGQSAECYPVNVKDGFECDTESHHGKCFEGECVRECYGDCCAKSRRSNEDVAKPDGTECDEGVGKCFNGVCVHACYGDCCEKNQSFAKPDGAPCMDGVCVNGLCESDSTTTGTGASGTNTGIQIDPLNGKKAIAVVVDESKKESELDSLWKQMTEQEHREHEEMKRKQEEKHKAEFEEKKKALQAEYEQEQANLQASNKGTEKSSNTLTYAIVGVGSFVGLLCIILIIVAIVSVSKKKEKAKKEAQNSEYYYEKF